MDAIVANLESPDEWVGVDELFASSATGMLLLDGEGRIRKCNRRFLELVRRSEEDVVGLVVAEVEPVLFPHETLAAIVGCLVSGEEVGLHWPNDVFAAGRKLAGVLVEVLASRRRIVGIGLNTNSRLCDAPAELHGTATTLVAGCYRAGCSVSPFSAISVRSTGNRSSKGFSGSRACGTGIRPLSSACVMQFEAGCNPFARSCPSDSENPSCNLRSSPTSGWASGCCAKRLQCLPSQFSPSVLGWRYVRTRSARFTARF